MPAKLICPGKFMISWTLDTGHHEEIGVPFGMDHRLDRLKRRYGNRAGRQPRIQIGVPGGRETHMRMEHPPDHTVGKALFEAVNGCGIGLQLPALPDAIQVKAGDTGHFIRPIGLGLYNAREGDDLYSAQTDLLPERIPAAPETFTFRLHSIEELFWAHGPIHFVGIGQYDR